MLLNGVVYSMEYNVIVPRQVKNDIQQIRFYKEKFNTYGSNVQKLMKEIYSSIELLETSPKIGNDLSSRIGFSTHFRYMVIEKEYLMFYFIDGKDVNVVRILSGKSNWQRTLFGSD